MRASAPVLFLTALLTAACSAEGASVPTSAPSDATPAPELVRLEVMTVSETLPFEVEVAGMTRGLMDRPSLAEGRGMVFLYDEPTAGSFWMKNTLIPLTIAFWDESGTIVAIRDMEPCTQDPCPLYGPGADYVGALEVNQGELEGATPGDTVELTLPESGP